MRTLRFAAAITLWIVPIASAQSTGNETVDTDLAQGFYLEQQHHDPLAAAKYFERVLKKPNVSKEEMRVARRHLARCREATSVQDLARLMPANAIFYAEVHEPGQHLEQVAEFLGLLSTNTDGRVADATSARRIPIDGPISLPVDFHISPALFDALSDVHGFAIAMTGFDREGPQGVIIIDAGGSDLVRGLVETGIQLLEPESTIEGYQTYHVENEVWLTVTNRTLIVSRSKQAIVTVIEQMANPSAEGLAGNSAFRQAREQCNDPLGFAFIGGQTLREIVLEQAGRQEAMMANAMFDLPNLLYVSAAVSTANEKLTVDARAQMAEGHNSLAYGLIRTSPISGESYQELPSSLAACAMFGLNDAGLTTRPAPRLMSALDVGRELFANIQEVAAFALPTLAKNAGDPLPNIGVVITAADVSRSEALWNQLLSLPSQIGIPDVSAPVQLTIDGHEASRFQLPDMPPVLICRGSDRHLVVGTEAAVRASLAEDDGFAPDPVSPNSDPAYKAIQIDVDRVLQLVAAMEPNAANDVLRIRQFVEELTVALSTHEAENSLQIHGEIRGFPRVRNLLEQVGRFQEEVDQDVLVTR